MIYTAQELTSLTNNLDSLRKDGQIIGLTHGVFDLFHEGHMFFLKAAAKQCDHLVVGVDSDKSVRASKGDQRPIFAENHRTELIDSMRFVGSTILIDFDLNDAHYVSLYKELSPNKIFVGEGFGFEDHMKLRQSKLGFELIAIKNRLSSTTDIINKIKQTTP